MARRGRKPAAAASATVPLPVTRDPETFDASDLANEIGDTMNAAKARIEILTTRINRASEERETLFRMVSGAERALGLDVPTSPISGTSAWR